MAESYEDADLQVCLPRSEALEDLVSHGEVAHGFDASPLYHLVLAEEQIAARTPSIRLERASPQLVADCQEVGQAHGSLELQQLVLVLQHLHQGTHEVQLLAVLEHAWVHHDAHLRQRLAGGVTGDLVVEVHEAEEDAHTSAHHNVLPVALLRAEQQHRGGHESLHAVRAGRSTLPKVRDDQRGRRCAVTSSLPGLTALQHAPSAELPRKLGAPVVDLAVLHRPRLLGHLLVHLLDGVEIVVVELVKGKLRLRLLRPHLVILRAAEVVDDGGVEEAELRVGRKVFRGRQSLHRFQDPLRACHGLLELAVDAQAGATLVETAAQPPRLIGAQRAGVAPLRSLGALPRCVEGVAQLRQEVHTVEDLLAHVLVVPCHDRQDSHDLGTDHALAAAATATLLAVGQVSEHDVNARAVDEVLARLAVACRQQEALRSIVLRGPAFRRRWRPRERGQHGHEGRRRALQDLRAGLHASGEQRCEAQQAVGLEGKVRGLEEGLQNSQRQVW
mmetsp:Transcript_17610/g.45411  ORF Transcript_17610/g.45411 Transcript_17610/m.45411 type:complete len:502 (-) Transcript_17610:461-1966(-)